MRVNSKSVRALMNHARVSIQLGYSETAIADFDQIIKLEPENAQAYNSRGYERYMLGRQYDAIEDFTAAIRFAPQASPPYENRGRCYFLLSQYEKALADYNEALRLDPQNHNALIDRARLFATASDEHLRNGAAAIDDAKRACELQGWKNYYALAALAAAHAETGDFEQAIAMQERANTLVTGAPLERGQGLVHLYKSGNPDRHNPQLAEVL
jgi:tetratricopeptide (TPR) repeat protein